MKRKITVPTLCLMLLALCLPTQAQQPKKVHRIGFLSAVGPAVESTRSELFRQALRGLGYFEGQNITIEYRYGEGNRDRGRELLAVLVRRRVDIIVVSPGDASILFGYNVTKTMPSVME